MKKLVTFVVAFIGITGQCVAGDTLEQRVRAVAAPAATQPARAGYVQVINLKGLAQVKVLEEKPWRLVGKGELLSPVAKLRTGVRSSVQLLTHDGRRINVNGLRSVNIGALQVAHGRSPTTPYIEHEATIRSPGKKLSVRVQVAEISEDGRPVLTCTSMSAEEYERWKQLTPAERRARQHPVPQPTAPVSSRLLTCVILRMLLPL